MKKKKIEEGQYPQQEQTHTESNERRYISFSSRGATHSLIIKDHIQPQMAICDKGGREIAVFDLTKIERNWILEAINEIHREWERNQAIDRSYQDHIIQPQQHYPQQQPIYPPQPFPPYYSQPFQKGNDEREILKGDEEIVTKSAWSWWRIVLLILVLFGGLLWLLNKIGWIKFG